MACQDTDHRPTSQAAFPKMAVVFLSISAVLLVLLLTNSSGILDGLSHPQKSVIPGEDWHGNVRRSHPTR